MYDDATLPDPLALAKSLDVVAHIVGHAQQIINNLKMINFFCALWHVQTVTKAMIAIVLKRNNFILALTCLTEQNMCYLSCCYLVFSV